jgi:hypothetical protein
MFDVTTRLLKSPSGLAAQGFPPVKPDGRTGVAKPLQLHENFSLGVKPSLGLYGGHLMIFPQV